MSEDHKFIAPPAMLLRPHDAKLTSGLQAPDLNGSPRVDTRQESGISSEKVRPLVTNSPELTATIVICTRNRPAEMRKCLSAISGLERVPDEVIVVDNTNGNEETESVSREFGATYIVEPNPGLSRARNRGLQESQSAIVVYLDDDAFPEKNWLGTLLVPFACPQIGLVTGETVKSRADLANQRYEACRVLNNADPEWFEIAAYGGLGIGANMALRRDKCTDWTVFDERMGRGAPLDGMEEHHAFVRLLFRGNRAVHLPDAVVIHSSQRPSNVILEARNSFAYWLILFSEYPDYRSKLIRFLVRRLFHRPLGWHRDSPDPGEIMASDLPSLVKAGIAGLFLFLRNRKPKPK
ncbi:MAG: glycosyltransferase family 2 protein [Terracidiphilus sp.]